MAVYGLALSTDLSPLVGSTLTFVGVGQFQLQLALSGPERCSLAIEGEYVLISPTGEPSKYTEVVAGAAALLRLLGETVVVAEVARQGVVRLTFSGGVSLEVLDSSDQYESYQLTMGDRLLVV